MYFCNVVGPLARLGHKNFWIVGPYHIISLQVKQVNELSAEGLPVSSGE
jgi:hypothetical protein